MSSQTEIICTQTIGSDWNQIAVILKTLMDAINPHIKDETHRSNISMSLNELIENVVKYAQDQNGGSIEIGVVTEPGAASPGGIHVQTKNSASEEAFGILQEELIGLDPGSNLEQEFQIRLVATAMESDISRLGLIRIAREAYGSIKATWENPLLTVNVLFPIVPPEEVS